MKTKANKSFTLIEFLAEQYPDSPRTRIKKLLQSGIIRVNDKPVTLNSYPLKPGDIVEINKQAGNAAKAGLPFPVLYEDQQGEMHKYEIAFKNDKALEKYWQLES